MYCSNTIKTENAIEKRSAIDVSINIMIVRAKRSVIWREGKTRREERWFLGRDEMEILTIFRILNIIIRTVAMNSRWTCWDESHILLYVCVLIEWVCNREADGLFWGYNTRGNLFCTVVYGDVNNMENPGDYPYIYLILLIWMNSIRTKFDRDTQRIGGYFFFSFRCLHVSRFILCVHCRRV